MTLRGANSFMYHQRGWTLSNCYIAGAEGQSGYNAIFSNAGITAGAEYGFANANEFIWGFCVKNDIIYDKIIWDAFFQGTSNPFASLKVNNDGSLAFLTTNRTIELGRSIPGMMASNIEHYIEVRIKTGTSTGQVEVRLNGDPTPILLLTGQNMGASDPYNKASLIGAPTGQRRFSAWYFVEVDATPPNTFLGHIRFGALTPNGNGASSQLVGSDGNSTDNYLLIDDGYDSDYDSTYVQSPTVGDKDTYALPSLPSTPLAIVAVQSVIKARKTDAGSRGITPLLRSGGTDYQMATEHFLGTSHDTFTQFALVDPATAAAWDAAGIAAMEVGMEVTT